ncbi:hypothetical protein PHYSODRAFT_338541 [Phytophthora sojae]|uniref:Pectinesterase n=1 Tax=Phytophthora sojae (strain P6497) TaxID=1094619 RepID=G5A2C7_PHYSP|nr:hypothetical protein PHYSODRAFT_338541 [Phytophthora sojae]EGZ09818.1 hypothetical protein PHYSODRAFT_338541 [Phytophthora sojae]|eukprot:XP_009534679.1 hypothetical protein PHYSODRAFT_338541 [Phytophthora sojae]
MRIFALPLVALASLLVSSSTECSCNGPDARTQPPANAIVGDPTGAYSGSFRNVSEAVGNVPNNTDEHTIFLFPGVYREQVLISKLNGPLVLQGYTCNTTSYAANEVTITHAKAQRDIPPEITSGRNDLTSTLRLKTNNVKGKELFARSYISGDVDFIFGTKAEAWFESCDIEPVGPGCITANRRVNESSPSFYVFNNARVFSSIGNGTAYLGRPWRPYSRVVWQNSELSDVIHPDGWQQWNKDKKTANRVSFSGVLDAPVPITQILGDNYTSEWYVDHKFL